MPGHLPSRDFGFMDFSALCPRDGNRVAHRLRRDAAAGSGGYSARRETRSRYGGTEMMSSVAQDRRAAPADRRWLVLLVVAVAQLMVVLDATVVNIALPSAQHSLGFSNNDRQWVVTCYALAFGSLLLLGGWIGDMFSRKRVLITGLAGFAVSSAVGGAAVSFPM